MKKCMFLIMLLSGALLFSHALHDTSQIKEFIYHLPKAELSKTDAEQRYIIYGGNLAQQRSQAHVIGWQSAGTLIEKLESLR